MDNAVKSRPNHYEVLGLSPVATGEEIAQAFARQLDPLRPRPFGSLAEVTVAFETLRDRTKREAYDISLGLKPKPKPPSPPPVVPPEWAPFAMRASPRPAPRPAVDPLPRHAPKADAPPRSEPVDEPKISPFVAAASSIEPNNADFREPRPKAPAEPLLRPEPTAEPRFEPPAGGDLLHFEESRRFRLDGADFSRWKLPALAAGALIFAVGIGAWTGLEAGNDNEQAQSENKVTLKVPAAKPLPELAGSPLTLAPSEAEARPQQPRRAPAAAAPVKPPRPPLRIDLPEGQPLEAAQAGGVATEQAAAEAPVIEAAAAKLPLPNAVIARTIGRIGYPCGQVASASALGSGVFKVTCTSGHSYRAAPVRGRYRFRRM